MRKSVPFSRIGIMGLGLMGGSLARSLKGLPDPPFIRGWSGESKDAEDAHEAGVIDEVGSGGRSPAFQDLDLLIYCTPLKATLTLLEEHAPYLGEKPTVTDVVSLKSPVLSAARRTGLARSFVGSHPMAGGEGSGFGASRAGLFRGATVWLVAGDASRGATAQVEAFWAALGSRPVGVEAGRHDTLMAWVSHLPQLTSNALAMALERGGVGPGALGPGGRDMVRLAGSSPDMWTDLLDHSPDELLRGLRELAEALTEIQSLLQEHRHADIGRIFKKTRAWTKGE